MGYNVSMNIEDLTIPKGNVRGALEALYGLTVSSDPTNGYWVESNFGSLLRKVDKLGPVIGDWSEELYPTLISTLNDCGYETKLTAQGDVQVLGFEGGKLGEDSLLWKTLSPYVTDGSIYCRGENEDLWVWEFTFGNMVEKWGTIVYS